MAAPASKQRPVRLGHRGEPHREVGHVEGAGDAVDQADADQEEQRRGEVDGDVVQARPDPRAARAVQQQAVGRRQQHLEEDEQVEEVAGQEGAVQPHQQELEQAVEMRARAVPARARRPAPAARAPRSAAASAPTAGRAPARCRTAPASCRAGRARPRCRPSGASAAVEQRDGDDRQQRRWRQADDRASRCRAPRRAASAPRRQRQQDRRDDQVLAPGSLVAAPCRRHGRCRSGRARRAARRGTAPSWRSR